MLSHIQEVLCQIPLKLREQVRIVVTPILARHNKRPQNQHHELENITIALDAVTDDGIKLVNIGRNNKLQFGEAT